MALRINRMRIEFLRLPCADAAISAHSALRKLAGSLPESLSSDVDRLLMGGDDGRDLFWSEALDCAASGAGELQRFKITPSQGYLELTSTIVRDGHANASDSHGWPILSVCGPNPTVTGSGEGSNPFPVEGAA